MAQTTHVAMTDNLKIELVQDSNDPEHYAFTVFELINGTWYYLDSASSTLPVNCSDGKIRKLIESIAEAYTDALNIGTKDLASITEKLSLASETEF